MRQEPFLVDSSTGGNVEIAPRTKGRPCAKCERLLLALAAPVQYRVRGTGTVRTVRVRYVRVQTSIRRPCLVVALDYGWMAATQAIMIGCGVSDDNRGINKIKRARVSRTVLYE